MVTRRLTCGTLRRGSKLRGDRSGRASREPSDAPERRSQASWQWTINRRRPVILVIRNEIMKSTVFLLLGLLVFAVGCHKDDIEIIQVKVWDKDFQVIHTIDDATGISAFRKLWEDRISVSQSQSSLTRLTLPPPRGLHDGCTILTDMQRS